MRKRAEIIKFGSLKVRSFMEISKVKVSEFKLQA
jgi:hypothetical protein